MSLITSRCRVIHDAAADGSWNMAVDEVLLDGADSTGGFVLRFYEWSCPTLSLGYFQRAADRVRHPASLACPLVRRPSGGGAILHDKELTYCAIVPRSDPRANKADVLYETFHTALIAALADCGAGGARFYHGGAGKIDVGPKGEPFLCFQRRAALDVMLQDAKIAGSAQRRRGGAVLMHGSVLLGTSPAAPELPGVADLSGRAVSAESLGGAWLDRLRAAFNWTSIASELTRQERIDAERLRATKYAAEAWNGRR